MSKIINTTTIQDVEELNATDLSLYNHCRDHPSWIRTQSPISCDELDRICDLAQDPKSIYLLGWSMGELNYCFRCVNCGKAFPVKEGLTDLANGKCFDCYGKGD